MWILMQQVNYWSYILHSSNTWEKKWIQWSSASALYRLQENLWFSWRGVLYNILIEFDIPMKLVRLIKMGLTEIYNIVWVGKNLTDVFPIRNSLKQGDALKPRFFSFSV